MKTYSVLIKTEYDVEGWWMWRKKEWRNRKWWFQRIPFASVKGKPSAFRVGPLTVKLLEYPHG